MHSPTEMPDPGVPTGVLQIHPESGNYGHIYKHYCQLKTSDLNIHGQWVKCDVFIM